MIILVLAVIGGVIGGLKAKKGQGKTADIAQYAAGYAIAFAILGLVASIILNRVF